MEYKKAFKTEKGRAEVLGVYDEILDKWKVPYEAINIDTGFGKTFIVRCGEKTQQPLILLHGTSSNSSMWIDDASEYSKYYCVYAIDIPGEPGKSEERQYSLKGSYYFEWLNELVDVLKLGAVSIVGISLGAWLAVGFASRYPEKVEKLVLLCPSGIGAQKASFMFKAIPLMFLGEWGKDKIAQLVNGGQPIPREAAEYSRLISRQFNLRAESIPVYSDDQLKKLKMPILLFAGEKDVLLDSKGTVRRISSLLPNAKSNLLPGYGHVLMGFKSKILEFLTE
jgi:pimeloyl-ACP methyl ester carboxylesterase